MKQIIRKLANKGRHNEFVWRYGYNLVPSVNYKLNSSGNTEKTSERVLTDLFNNGIAITSIDELSGTLKYFSELEAYVDDILEQRDEEIKELKRIANDNQTIGGKTFNIELLGSEINFDADNVLAKFSLQDTILDIANSYFKMLVKLRYYNVWFTLATQSKARESQLWHYDREDNYILKLFLYLRDVDEGTGPFTYAPGTHKQGMLNNIEPEYFMEGAVRRTNDEQMSACFPKENWITATGKKGTLVFADTHGFHKGGEARTNDRLMFTCMFTSQASESKRLLKCPKTLNLDSLTEKQKKALLIN